ncbi:uncharacterized protein LOC122067419 [Macadamia integrifolia]|uniref:uncharacterized protein LOC122067419 n=1 Tax=Macadamia integrifolia TaxID=60698 RepID=UPI001C4EB3B1|nr:uncharacterized protein LOC122067419 [Macadamia integrifolia]
MELNKTLISLIPKVVHPELADQFRPISLCNVIFKVITKLIAERLQGALHQIIDPTQSAFIPNRLISDNILAAHEIFHSIKKQKKGKAKFLALKLDMRKTYDRLEWRFIEVRLHEVTTLKHCLDLYCKATGQFTNLQKSSLTFSPNTYERFKRWFSRVLKVPYGDGPSTYLGLPTDFEISKKLDALFRSNKKLACESLSRASFLCRYLWCARNGLVFNVKIWTPQEVITVAEKAYVEFTTTNTRDHQQNVAMGGSIHAPLEKWSTPAPGYIKVNCDATLP